MLLEVSYIPPANKTILLVFDFRFLGKAAYSLGDDEKVSVFKTAVVALDSSRCSRIMLLQCGPCRTVKSGLRIKSRHNLA